ncbi:hypothetical protein HS088_TW11G00741 [Tripterygium wilfordii]|uniref:Uncharacterized protein n=1 Tax=Tripterygium wilfordii TaxID=458696 RepID=A0A7J7D2U1_TRIWF|nr:hypothetical protein HS088_TW11G00741 [Tripterygium wilfordii]
MAKSRHPSFKHLTYSRSSCRGVERENSGRRNKGYKKKTTTSPQICPPHICSSSNDCLSSDYLFLWFLILIYGLFVPKTTSSGFGFFNFNDRVVIYEASIFIFILFSSLSSF